MAGLVSNCVKTILKIIIQIILYFLRSPNKKCFKEAKMPRSRNPTQQRPSSPFEQHRKRNEELGDEFSSIMKGGKAGEMPQSGTPAPQRTSSSSEQHHRRNEEFSDDVTSITKSGESAKMPCPGIPAPQKTSSPVEDHHRRIEDVSDVASTVLDISAHVQDAKWGTFADNDVPGEERHLERKQILEKLRKENRRLHMLVMKKHNIEFDLTTSTVVVKSLDALMKKRKTPVCIDISSATETDDCDSDDVSQGTLVRNGSVGSTLLQPTDAGPPEQTRRSRGSVVSSVGDVSAETRVDEDIFSRLENSATIRVESVADVSDTDNGDVLHGLAVGDVCGEATLLQSANVILLEQPSRRVKGVGNVCTARDTGNDDVSHGPTVGDVSARSTFIQSTDTLLLTQRRRSRGSVVSSVDDATSEIRVDEVIVSRLDKSRPLDALPQITTAWTRNMFVNVSDVAVATIADETQDGIAKQITGAGTRCVQADERMDEETQTRDHTGDSGKTQAESKNIKDLTRTIKCQQNENAHLKMYINTFMSKVLYQRTSLLRR